MAKYEKLFDKSVTKIDEIYSMIDKNGKGTISKLEMLQFVKNLIGL